MDSKRREHVLIVVTLFCLGALVGDRLVLTPMLEAWENRAQRIVQLRSDLAKGETLLRREREIRRRWREMQRDALPADISLAEGMVLKAVDRWVTESGVTLQSLKPQWRQFEEPYQTLECRAVAQGGIEAIARFLHELEGDPLSLRVEDLEIAARDGEGRLLIAAITFGGIQFKPEEGES